MKDVKSLLRGSKSDSYGPQASVQVCGCGYVCVIKDMYVRYAKSINMEITICGNIDIPGMLYRRSHRRTCFRKASLWKLITIKIQ